MNFGKILFLVILYLQLTTSFSLQAMHKSSLKRKANPSNELSFDEKSKKIKFESNYETHNINEINHNINEIKEPSHYKEPIIHTPTKKSRWKKFKNTKKNLLSRAFDKAKLVTNNVGDSLIRYTIIEPSKLWFSAQSLREQERMVLESPIGSLARRQFETIHGSEQYQKLITNKPEHHNSFSKLSPTACALLLATHLPLPHLPITTNQPNDLDFSNQMTLFDKDVVDTRHPFDLDIVPGISFQNNTINLHTNTYQNLTSKEWLDNYALNKGLGYKTANLTVLFELIKDPILENLPGGIKVFVPEYAGVSDESIKNFLKHHGLNFEKEWDDIVQKPSLHEKKHAILPKEFTSKLEELADKVQQIFDSVANSITQNTSLNNLLFTSNLDELIELCKQKNSFITTRSTGREDTEELANAGGNVSNEIVDANPSDVLRGIGSNVSSYLREKSIGQRALLKDPKLFDTPLMPALIQRVVAETPNLPFSGCVAYTREPQGNHPGITISQCTHGHTKAVVDSLVPLDTFTCSTTHCYPVIKEKNERSAPVLRDGKKFNLDLIENENNIQDKTSITQDELHALQHVMQFIEYAYGKPMDLELSFDHKNRILYLYQARPLVIKRSLQPASYIINDQNLGKAITCTTVSQAGGSLRLAAANRMIIQETLEDALNFYLRKIKNGESFNFDLVIVKKNADPTSHAAATFNGMAKPIMIAHDYKQLTEWLQNPNLELLADVQRGNLYDLSQTEFHTSPLSSLFARGLALYGLRSYPIAQALSVINTSPQQNQLNYYAQLSSQLSDLSLENLVEKLKTESFHEANTALNEILHRLAKQIIIKQDQVLCPGNKTIDCSDNLSHNCQQINILNSLCYTSIPAKKALKKLNTLFGLALEIRDHISSTISKQAYSPERLFPISMLETILFQKPNMQVINSYSHQSVLETYQKSINFIKSNIMSSHANSPQSSSILTNHELFEMAQEGNNAAITQAIAQNWNSFIFDVSTHFTSEQQNELVSMFKNIKELGMLPAWMNTRFACQNGTAIQSFEALLREYYENKNVLIELKKYANILHHTNFSLWKEEKLFVKIKKSFDETIFTWFTSDSFINIIKNRQNNPFAYQAAVSTMSTFVETFDQIIKAIKSSNTIPEETRVEYFGSMVGKYFELLENWVQLVPSGVISYHKDFPLEHFMHWLKSCFYSIIFDKTAAQLLPSEGFNVGVVTLGSGSLYPIRASNYSPNTLEDIFTTVHQSLLVVIGALTSSNMCEKSLPQNFIDLAQKIPTERKPQLTAINFKSSDIIYDYNIPLTWHSVKVSMIYSRNSPAVSVNCNFYGYNKDERWDYITFYTQLSGFLYNFSVDGIPQQSGLSLVISNITPENTDNFIEVLQKIIDLSMILYFSKSNALELLRREVEKTSIRTEEEKNAFFSQKIISTYNEKYLAKNYFGFDT